MINVRDLRHAESVMLCILVVDQDAEAVIGMCSIETAIVMSPVWGKLVFGTWKGIAEIKEALQRHRVRSDSNQQQRPAGFVKGEPPAPVPGRLTKNTDMMALDRVVSVVITTFIIPTGIVV